MKMIKKNNAKTILFISGMFAGGWMWKETQPKIGNSYHMTIDDPLSGLGNKVSTFSSMIGEQIKQISQPISIVGNSLGSLVALDVARQNKEKVERVMISGSAGFGDVNLGLKLSRHQAEKFVDELLGRICYDKNKVSYEDSQRIANVFREYMRNVVGLIRESNSIKADAILSEVHCPVHAIWGEDDAVTPIDSALNILKKHDIPLTTVKQCGHSPMYEKPEEFAYWTNLCMNN